jgi:hypothetical protein
MQCKNTTLTKLFISIILISIGLWTKIYSGIGSEFVTNYLGGVIYVIFFVLVASLVFQNIDPSRITLIVLCTTCLLEFSQLVQNDFLYSLRTNFVIRSLIGSVFNIFDFIFYIIGAVIGYALLIILKNIKQ